MGGKKRKKKKKVLLSYLLNSPVAFQLDIFSTSGYYITDSVMQSEGGPSKTSMAIP